MKTLAMVALLISGSAQAQEMCDLQGHCYPGQKYHMDPAHPDKETPPPAPQYHIHAPQVARPKTQCELEHCYPENGYRVPTYWSQ